MENRLENMEMTNSEIEEVAAGFGLVGSAIGAAISGYSAYHSGASFGSIAGATIFGGVSGFFGGVASVAGSRFATGMFGSYSVGTGFGASLFG